MSSVVSPAAVVEPTLYVLAASVGLYGLFISLLTIPHVQNQVIYLNSVTLTLGQDVNIPEQWGFLRNLELFSPSQTCFLNRDSNMPSTRCCLVEIVLTV